jgi:hypothetical protein
MYLVLELRHTNKRGGGLFSQLLAALAAAQNFCLTVSTEIGFVIQATLV